MHGKEKKHNSNSFLKSQIQTRKPSYTESNKESESEPAPDLPAVVGCVGTSKVKIDLQENFDKRDNL
jgi:hypothetical protein